MRRSVLLALAVVGCAEPLDPTFIDELTVIGGCGDVVLYARNEADTLMLRATRARGLVDEVELSGDTEQAFAEFPSDEIAVVLQVGERLSDATCDDVVEDGGPVVQTTWVPTDGSATLSVDPPVRGEGLPRADLVLGDVVFAPERGGRDPVEVEDFQILDVTIGWYAG